MPWMICTCRKRFYTPPSQMTDAQCDDCTEAKPRWDQFGNLVLPEPKVAPDPVGFREAWDGYGNLPRRGEDQ